MGQLSNVLIFIGIFIITLVLFIVVGNIYLEDPSNLFVLFILVSLMFLFIMMSIMIGALALKK